MAERMPVRHCPRCGAPAPDRYCARCGTDMDQAWAADAPLFTHQRSGWSTGAGDPDRTVETGQIRSWSGAPGPVTADSPTVVLPMGATGAAGLLPGWAEARSASPGNSGAGSRRRAVLAVLAVAAATAVVLFIALLVAPSWGAKPNGRSSIVPPGPGRSGTAASATDSTQSTAPPTTSPTAIAPVDPGTDTGSPTVTTVTVTTRAPAGTTGRSTAPRTTAPATASRTSRPTPVLPNLGVPHQDLACRAGFVVQVASALTPAAFSQRVMDLRAAGQLPQESRAALAGSSCRIFENQRNGLVLYAGPFSGRYDGCPARLAGPPDAYIKGTSPGTARTYVSCLCPADPAGLPRILDPGQRDVWVGELQRILAARLNFRVPDVVGQWGVYTPGTRTAVMDFQRQAQLFVDGRVGPLTWRALQTAEC